MRSSNLNLLAFGSALLTLACGEVTAPPVPLPVSAMAAFSMAPSRVDYDITCTTEIHRRKTSCDMPTAVPSPTSAVVLDLILTQGPYFTLVNSANSCSGRSCSETNAIQNLMVQPVGVNALGVVSGIKVVFKSISAAKNNGTLVDIDMTAPDGTGTFTFPDGSTLSCTRTNASGAVVANPCPYYLYNEAVNPHGTSAPRTWAFTMAPSAATFTYTVNVSAALPEENAALLWVKDQQDVTSVDGLFGVHGTSNAHVLAVGAGGLIQHFNGSNWTTMPSGVSSRLNSVWSASSTHGFAGGFQNTMLRYNGSTWSPMTIPAAPNGTSVTTWYGVYGFSSANAYAVGTFGQIRHWDGAAWSAVPSPTTQHLTSVWGTSASNIYATGVNGTLVRFDGAAWQVLALPGVTNNSSSNLYNVWGSSANDVYVAGRNGLLFHSTDGTTFTAVTLPGGYGGYVWGLWGTGANDVYLSTGSGNILHWDGVKWWTHNTGQTAHLFGMWGTSVTNMFGAGANKTIVRGAK